MQPEAIRAFKRTWKPRPLPRAHATARAQLALVPSPEVVQATQPRVSLANPLPPPSPVALGVVGQRGFGDPGSGVRRRPNLEVHAPREAPKQVPKRVEASAPCGVLERGCDEEVDPEPEILCMYVVPPVPPRARKQDPTIEIEDDWLEPVAPSSAARRELATGGTHV